VKTARLAPFILIPLLFACFPKKPEISLPAVPAQPLMRALEQRRQTFSGLKAAASVESVRSGRKRSYDTVGIVIEDQRRLRMEAYGPLGQSLVTLVWDGADVLLRLDDGRVLTPGPAGLERMLGMAMGAGELCAVLTGNVPAAAPGEETKAYREPDGSYMIEQRSGDLLRRLYVLLPEPGADPGIRITASELYRSGKLVYRARYEHPELISRYLIAKTVGIENPDKKVSLTVEYNEMDVNVPLSDDAFKLTDDAAAGSNREQ
jgi:outer membrane lipoprotein-sorting protein